MFLKQLGSHKVVSQTAHLGLKFSAVPIAFLLSTHKGNSPQRNPSHQ